MGGGGNLLKNINRSLSILILSISCFLFYWTNNFPLKTAFFPRVILTFLILMSILLFFTNEQISIDVLKRREKIIQLLVFFITFVYAILFNKIGFFISTSLYLVIIMVLLGAKKWRQILSVTIILQLIIYFLFVKQLNIPFPKGMFF